MNESAPPSDIANESATDHPGPRETLPPARRTCYLALPHSGAMVPEALAGIMNATSMTLSVDPCGGSLLAYNFNQLWTKALNAFPRPDFFAMHHSDIMAPPGWVDDLIEEMDAADADVCSAVVAIKDGRGFTSTALLDTQGGEGPGLVRRVTQQELAVLPQTFDRDRLAECYGKKSEAERFALLLNSGLWVCRFGWGARQPDWIEKVNFSIGDRIDLVKDETHPTGQRYVARCYPEDWAFSTQLAALGVRAVASQRLRTMHFGRHPFALGGASHRPYGVQSDAWITL